MLIAPVAVIPVAENLGHLKAVAGMTGRSMDPYMGRAFVGDGRRRCSPGRWAAAVSPPTPRTLA